jgi:predicted site-specific integrase-resolvase
MKKIKLSTFAKLNDVTQRTVWNWINKGMIKFEKTSTNRVFILVDEENPSMKDLRVAVYARVSSSENKSNLERQKDRLVSYANAKGYQVEKIVTEIGSGLNDNRPKLEKLLIDKTIDIIIVEHKDRLARFGINYIEKLLALDGRKIEIVNPQLDEKDDLMQDFVSIITSFCARLYGKRRTKRQTEKLIQELSSNIEK